jgi:hypothetical protein
MTLSAASSTKRAPSTDCRRPPGRQPPGSKVRVPGSGKRVSRLRPESEWVTVDAPHLRIVSAELFSAVERRFETVKRVFAKDAGGLAIGPQRYLFSGLLKCGECGGSIVLVCGRGRHGADRYGVLSITSAETWSVPMRFSSEGTIWRSDYCGGSRMQFSEKK